ncbi:hypothetical protein HDU96_009338 [Phlyctochytrium bullatum]|nr:hypothetical protein HDU96_009338 [Phlyctochytrium bullatum]
MDIAIVQARFADASGRVFRTVDYAALPAPDEHTPGAGTPVMAIGYGLFGPVHAFAVGSPSVSHGVLGKVVRHPGTANAARLQSSAVIHNGASGGGLFSLELKKSESSPTLERCLKLVGVLTSNLKVGSGTNAAIIPFLAYAVPLPQPYSDAILAACRDGRNTEPLKRLEWVVGEYSVLWGRGWEGERARL